MRETIRRIRAWASAHKAATAVIEAAVTILLAGLLVLVGVLPAPHATGTTPAPRAQTGTHATQPRHRKQHAAPDAIDDTGDPAAHAKRLSGQMSDLLARPSGVDSMTIGRLVEADEQWDDLPLSKAERTLTDEIKTDTATPPTDPKGIGKANAGLDKAMDAWRAQVWASANSTLRNLMTQMDEAAMPARDTIGKGGSWPGECTDWAGDRLIGGDGATERDFDAKKAEIAAFNQAQQACAAHMTPEQAARMPQDGSRDGQ